MCVCVHVCVFVVCMKERKRERERERASEVAHDVPLSKNPLVAQSSSSNDSAKKSLAAKLKGSLKNIISFRLN